MYGPETLEQVAPQSQGHRRPAGRVSPSCRSRVVWKPVLLDSGVDPPAILEANSAPGCVGVIAWMHTFSPAKMWISGLDALQKPLLHLHTQAGMALPWSTIDMDFMNLNQAAHGDREFGHIQSRLRRRAQDRGRARGVAGSWSRGSPRGRAPRSGAPTCGTCGWPGSATTCATWPSPRATRSRPQLRFGVSVNTYGVNDLVAVVDEVADGDIDKLVTEYADTYRVAPELLPGGDRHDSLRYGARVELGLRAFLGRGRLRAPSPRTSRTSEDCVSSPASPSSG